MQIHYWSSSTGNTKALAGKLDIPTRDIIETAHSPTILMIPTFEQPRLDDYVPRYVREWVGHYGQHVVGVIGTGNRNFGDDYCRAAVDVARDLGVRVLYRCELRGTSTDVANINDGVRQHWDTLVNMRTPQNH